MDNKFIDRPCDCQYWPPQWLSVLTEAIVTVEAVHIFLFTYDNDLYVPGLHFIPDNWVKLVSRYGIWQCSLVQDRIE
jgi:hypothetical protein